MPRRSLSLTPSLAEGRTIARRVKKLANARIDEMAYQRTVLTPVRRQAIELVRQLDQTLQTLQKLEQKRPTRLPEFLGDRFGEIRDQIEKHLVRLGVLLAYELQITPMGPGRPVDAVTPATEALSLAGMSIPRIAKVLQSVGLEGAGDAKRRIRQRRKRQGGSDSVLLALLPDKTSTEALREIFDGAEKSI